MRAIEFAGQRVVPRQLHQLLVAGVAFIVDADNALDPRRPAVGAGKPAAGFLDPEHRGGGRCPHAIFDAVGRAVAPARGRRLSKRIRRGSSAPARSVWKTPRRLPARRPGYRQRPRSPDRSRPSRRSRYPRQRRPGRAKRGWSRLLEGRLAEVRMSRTPRFRTLPGDSRSARILPVSAPTLRKVHKEFWKPRCAPSGNQSGGKPARPLRRPEHRGHYVPKCDSSAGLH